MEVDVSVSPVWTYKAVALIRLRIVIPASVGNEKLTAVVSGVVTYSTL